jgi:hypothetical protein
MGVVVEKAVTVTGLVTAINRVTDAITPSHPRTQVAMDSDLVLISYAATGGVLDLASETGMKPTLLTCF